MPDLIDQIAERISCHATEDKNAPILLSNAQLYLDSVIKSILTEELTAYLNTIIEENGTIAEHSGETHLREWHGGIGWLCPGDKVVHFSAEDLRTNE